MQNRNIVKQDYRLVNAKYKLNTSEIKFILAGITQINADDEDFKEYEIRVSELEEILQAEQNETRLKQFAKKLLSKPLEIPTDKGFMIFNWFSKIQYIRGEAKFIVRIDPDLKPYLLNLKKRFVKYNLRYILPMTSNYSIRLYQLLKEYEKLTKRTFTVEELQEILQVPKSLKRYDNFKRKVLKVAEKELIEYADIFFEFEEIKQGRKVTKILFRIKPNPDNRANKSKNKLFDDTPDPKHDYTRYYGKNALINGKVYKHILLIEEYSNNKIKVRFSDDTSFLMTEDDLKKFIKDFQKL